MNINRARPPKGCKDLELWLSGTINDAIRDAREAGLDDKTCAYTVLFYARHAAGIASLSEETIRRLMLDERKSSEPAVAGGRSAGMSRDDVTDGAKSFSAQAHAELWAAINEYTHACGGDTSVETVGDRRMAAVARVDRVVREMITSEEK